MVDWQYTVFCREVRFVEIYAFLVLIFFGQKSTPAIFITFCISARFPSWVVRLDGGSLTTWPASAIQDDSRAFHTLLQAIACATYLSHGYVSKLTRLIIF